MNELQVNDKEKVQHIIAFLICIFGETTWMHSIMHLSPDYLIDKWENFMTMSKNYPSLGLHALLIKELYEPYCDKWGLK